MAPATTEQLIEVGVVAGTHGLRGDLKIRTLPTGDLALSDARRIYLKDAAGEVTSFLADRTTSHKQFILLRLMECADVDSAKLLVGRSVWIPAADVPAAPDGRFFWHQLEGLEVIDARLGSIGRVVGMFTTAAHDVLEIAGDRGEVLIPAIAPFVTTVDALHGRLQVDLPEGLVPAADQDEADGASR